MNRKESAIVIIVLFLFSSSPLIGGSNAYLRENSPCSQQSDSLLNPRSTDGKQRSDYQSFQANETPGIQWMKTFGKPEAIDIGFKVRQTRDGGYILTGNNEAYVTQGWIGEWLIKTDSAGNEQWNKTFDIQGNNSITFGRSVEQTQDGGYILAGILTNESGTFGRLLKTDSNGNEQWNKTYFETESGDGGIQTTDGGYILVGGSKQGTPWIGKTDANGSELWNRSFFTSFNGYSSCVQETKDGGFIITGRLYHYNTRNPIQEEGFLVKTDENGIQQWNLTYGHPQNSGLLSVHQTLDEGYVMTGITTVDGNDAGYLVRTDRNGTILWNRSFFYDSNVSYGGWEVDCTKDGGFIVAGEIAGDVTQGWIVKTDANGTIEWFINTTEKYGIILNSVRETDDGCFIVAGTGNVETSIDAVLIKIGHVPHVTITKPINALYLFNLERRAFCFPFIIGPITIEADAYDTEYSIERVEFAVDDVLKYTDTTLPYSWRWITPSFFTHTLTVTAYNAVGNCFSRTINVLKIF